MLQDALERDDKGAIGTYDGVQSLIREVFPDVRFAVTTSGLEKLQLAAERRVDSQQCGITPGKDT